MFQHQICLHISCLPMKGNYRFNIFRNFHLASSEIPTELTLNCVWLMRDRDVIKPRCDSDSLTLPEECGADAGGDTGRWMNARLSAGLLITAALPTAQSQARNVWSSLERTAGEETVPTTVDLMGLHSGGVAGHWKSQLHWDLGMWTWKWLHLHAVPHFLEKSILAVDQLLAPQQIFKVPGG